MIEDKLYKRLLELGYIKIKGFNGEPYDGNDYFFCVQAPTLYILFINNEGVAQVEKIGKDGFVGICSVNVSNISDVNKLHDELNEIILKGEKKSLKQELSKGCMFIFTILLK